MQNKNIEKNLKKFSEQYSLKKKNYNIIISGNDGCGKYDLVESIIKKYFYKNNFKLNSELLNNPDIHHISIPIYDRSGKTIRTIDNNERLLSRFGFEDKIEGNRVGTEITVDQVRELSQFVSYSSRYNHKFIIINNIEDLNNEACAAFLKTLEETNTSSIFFLLNSEVNLVPDTIKSRCHTFNFDNNNLPVSGDNFLEYFLSSRPTLNNIFINKNYMQHYSEVEHELHLLYKREIDPLVLAEKWNTRGIIIIDYLISIFNILMKGNYLKNNSTIKNLYTSLFKVISISPSRSIAILKLLLENKRYSFYNLNQKLYFDNLLIVLNKNLY